MTVTNILTGRTRECLMNYEALERFAIMTVDGGLSDRDAIIAIIRQYGEQIAREVWSRTRSNNGN